jgi:hypothetical protein
LLQEETMPSTLNEFPPERRPLIPIVLGVVGHRDIPADSYLRAKIEKTLNSVFDQFERAYPNSPKILISPLAPGADQFAARVALDRKKDWSIRAPLPFAPGVYEGSTSFQTVNEYDQRVRDEAGIAAFRNFLNDPHVEWFVIPLPDRLKAERTAEQWSRLATGVSENGEEDNALRRACYANPGGYIVRNCHTLIALWDGEEPERPSGTAEIVRFQLEGIPPKLYPWTRDEPLGFDGDRGPVLEIRTPRPGGHGDDAVAGTLTVRVPSRRNNQPYGEVIRIRHTARRLSRLGRFWERIKHALESSEPRKALREYTQFLSINQKIDDFNREARAIRPEDVASSVRYEDRLRRADADAATFPESPVELLISPQLGACYRQFLRVRETAAHLSGRLSPTFEWIGTALFVLLFFALLTFHLYAHPLGIHGEPVKHPRFLLAVFGGIWVLLALIVTWVWWVGLDERRLDYRALAEAFRVRRAWARAGIARSVSRTYLGQLRSEVIWIRRALQHLCPPSEYWSESFQALDPKKQADQLQEVLTSWVQGQESQHHKQSRNEHTRARWFRRGGFTLAILGLSLFGCLLWPMIVGMSEAEVAESVVGAKNRPWLDPSEPRNEILVLGSMLIILGGLIVAICERRGHEELSKQYERIYVLFRSGKHELTAALAKEPPDIQRAQEIIVALGQEAVQENAQWLLLRRSKPLELPLGA